MSTFRESSKRSKSPNCRSERPTKRISDDDHHRNKFYSKANCGPQKSTLSYSNEAALNKDSSKTFQHVPRSSNSDLYQR